MNNINYDDILAIISSAKFKEDIDGSFYKNGWCDACNYILNKILNNNNNQN